MAIGRQQLQCMVLWVTLIVTGCSTPREPIPQVEPASRTTMAAARGWVGAPGTTHDVQGQQAAQLFQSLHEGWGANCGTPTMPAYLCSGVLLRDTGNGIGYHTWNPNPTNPKKGGVSFSWMRQDAQFQSVVFRSGILLLPESLYGSNGYRQMHVLCAFPIDGYTDWRADSGCGAERNYPTASKPCQALGINTYTEWLARYNHLSAATIHETQCGFTVRIGTANSADAFMQMLHVKWRVTGGFSSHDEVVIAEWPQDVPASLPIGAFFYTTNPPYPGEDTGVVKARRAQADFFRQTTKWLPVLRLTMPSSKEDGSTRYTYSPQDQDPGIP